jgi:hypothetical protein
MRNDATISYLDDPVAATGHLIVVGRNEHRSPVPGYLQQSVEDEVAVDLILFGGRLVGEHHFGISRQSTCNRHSLLLATRQLLREVLSETAKGQTFQSG